MKEKKISEHNASFWDNEANSESPWSQPVSTEIITSAKSGNWAIHVTKKKLPEGWLPKNINSKDILCLASAGGQQAPVLAAAGANVTVFDISEQQLEQDKLVAKRDDLSLKTIQGDMNNLACLSNDSFDFIVHPISNIYAPDLTPVWNECYRVLRKNGVLISSFYNPVLFIFEKNKSLDEKGLLKPVHNIPYSDLTSLDKGKLQNKIDKGEPLCFGHSLTEQIQGQIKAGFVLAGFYEDNHPSPRFLIEGYMPTMIATRAIKI